MTENENYENVPQKGKISTIVLIIFVVLLVVSNTLTVIFYLKKSTTKIVYVEKEVQVNKPVYQEEVKEIKEEKTTEEKKVEEVHQKIEIQRELSDEVLSIDWQIEKATSSIDDLFIASTTNEVKWDSAYKKKYGVVANGKFKNAILYLVGVDVMEMGYNTHYLRLLSLDGNVYLIKKHSEQIYGNDNNYPQSIILAENLTIEGLSSPDQIEIPNSPYKLYEQSWRGILFSNGKDNLQFQNDGAKVYGNLGTYYILLADSSEKYYYPKFNLFKESKGYDGYEQTSGVLNVTWSDDTKNEEDYSYDSFSYGGCGTKGIPTKYNYNIDSNSKLITVGKLDNGDDIYELEGQDLHAIYNEIYLRDSMTYEEFLEDRPFVYWKDPFGDYLGLRKSKYNSGAECGKPVIYLYPEEEIDAQVYVSPTGGFSITEPNYKNGWHVHATPKSELYNYDNGKTYPYLFWEGFGLNYNRPKEGFVVERKNVKEFLEEKLAQLGLIQKEYDEFIEFWLPKMQDKPFYFITFVPQEEFNLLAPLKVIPSPDTVIRVFMDYEGLEQPINVSEQTIVTPERNGFTVVEWGGALHR